MIASSFLYPSFSKLLLLSHTFHQICQPASVLFPRSAHVSDNLMISYFSWCPLVLSSHLAGLLSRPAAWLLSRDFPFHHLGLPLATVPWWTPRFPDQWPSAFLAVVPHFAATHLQFKINFWKLHIFIQTSHGWAGCKVENNKLYM